MALLPLNTRYIVTYWVPLPTPLGIESGTEISVKSSALFPENTPGFYAPDHPEGRQYLSQSWMVFQKTTNPSSSVMEFAEELFEERAPVPVERTGQPALGLDVGEMLAENLGAQWHTVVEVMCPIENTEPDCIVDKLNEVISALADMQIKINQVNGISSHLYTPSAFEPVPYSVSSSEGEFLNAGVTTVRNFTKYSNSVNVPTASPEELQQVSGLALGMYDPFRSAAVLDMEADSARLTGANILAAICYGAAAEARLIELGIFLSWEAEEDTAKVAKKLPTRGTVRGSFLQYLADHLGGSWDRLSSEPIRNWDQNIVQLRNDTAHGGYEPTVREIELAMEAMLGLREFIQERLLARADVYPFVAEYYLGSVALQSSQRFEAWKNAMSNYPLTPYPEKSFSRYKTEVRARNIRSHDDLVGGTVIEITATDGQVQWIELDEQSLLCRYIAPPSQAGARELQRIEGRVNQRVTTERLIDVGNADLDPLGEWIPSSSMIPSYSTMRSDMWEATDYRIYPRD